MKDKERSKRENWDGKAEVLPLYCHDHIETVGSRTYAHDASKKLSLQCVILYLCETTMS